jgi:hypothetical protein
VRVVEAEWPAALEVGGDSGAADDGERDEQAKALPAPPD